MKDINTIAKSDILTLFDRVISDGDSVVALAALQYVGERGGAVAMSDAEVRPFYLAVLGLAVGGDKRRLSRMVLGQNA